MLHRRVVGTGSGFTILLVLFSSVFFNPAVKLKVPYYGKAEAMCSSAYRRPLKL